MLNNIKAAFGAIRAFLVWICPFIIAIAVVAALVCILESTFDNYIRLIQSIVWPLTILIGLFFFRKVVTYMFFSMDKFNFFGVTGELTNVNLLIDREVQKLILQKEAERKQEIDNAELITKLSKKEAEAGTAKASAKENLELAQEIYRVYKLYQTNSEAQINLLKEERQLMIDGNATPQSFSAQSENPETPLGNSDASEVPLK